MKNKPLYLFVFIAVIIVIIGLVILFYSNKKSSSEQANSDNSGEGNVAGVTTEDQDFATGLAKYMTAQGMVMYGAYWCPHCKSQKEIFGDAFKYVDYVECDASGPDANPDECVAKGIEGYPTWIYNGTKYSGDKSLQELANIVGYNQK
ncbi:MAG: protein disulfide isomerase family protein [Patescibacteria group bacterium]|jgi:protein-disulfide isomerase